MLTKRVIPCLDVKDGRVVKGVNFVSLRDAGDPVELARAYDREGADEVVFLDITATSDNRATTIEMAAFSDCTSLTSISATAYVYDNIKLICGFSSCQRLTNDNLQCL